MAQSTGSLDRWLSVEGSREPSIEGLRGLAIALVFIVHYQSGFGNWLGPGARRVMDLAAVTGHAGVELFFILSGYLVYGLAMSKQRPYGAFIRRRLQRIYPVYALVFAIYLAISLVWPERSRVPLQDTTKALVYLMENLALMAGIFDIRPMILVAWSLSYELFFYLTVPALVSVLRLRDWRRGPRCALLLAMGAAYALWSLLDREAYWKIGPVGSDVAIHVRLLLFLAGMMCWELPPPKSRPGWAVMLLALGLAWYAAVQGRLLWLPDYERSHDLYAVTGFGLAAMPFCRHCFHGGPLRWMPLRWLGNVSYSFYLIHGLVVQACVMLAGKHGPVTYVLGVVPVFLLCFLAAAVVFVSVEKPYSLSRRVV